MPLYPNFNSNGIVRIDHVFTNLTVDQYNGSARPGELVVDLVTYQLYISNAMGNLNPVTSSGGSVSTNGITNGTTSLSVPQVNGNIVITIANTNSWSFDTNGALNGPVVNNSQVSWSGASTIVKGNPYTVYGTFGTPAVVYKATSANIVACKLFVRLQYLTNDVEFIEINAVKTLDGSSVDSTISHLRSGATNLMAQLNVSINSNNQISVSANSQNGQDFYSTFKVTEFDITN